MIERRGGSGIRRLALAPVIGIAVAAVAAIGSEPSQEGGLHALCRYRLRMVRHAVNAFEAEHGVLPGFVRGADGRPVPLDGDRAAAVAAQLTWPLDANGRPVRARRGLIYLPHLPVNPYTDSRSLVVVPPDVAATGFAAASRAGWAYVPDDRADAGDGRGPLPAGVVLPCGSASYRAPKTRNLKPVADIAFRVEEFHRWR